MTIAVVYCLYTAFIAGDNHWSTGLTWLIALVSAAALGVLCYAVGRWQRGRQPETIGTAYAVVFGCAMGYLLSLNDWSVLKSSLAGAVLAAAMGVSAFYIAHTHNLRADLPGRFRRSPGTGTRGRRAIRRPVHHG